MEGKALLQNESYDPNRLIDWVLEQMHLRNDAHLCRKLEMQPLTLSRIRHRKMPVGDSMLVKLHDFMDLPIREIRKRMFAS